MPLNMLPFILKYFRAEKDAGFYILIVGAVIIALGAWLWWSGSRYRAMAIPLIAIAIIEVIVGSVIYTRSDKQIDTQTEQYYTDREAYAIAETARMEQVMSGFQIYKWIEISLMVVGAGLAIVYRKRPSFVGVGVGLLIQAAIMLGFDIFAAQRAQVYLDALHRIA
jgi:hypothetical protein